MVPPPLPEVVVILLPGELFTETNDNSMGILLTLGAARVLLAGDTEKRSEEYISNGPYTGPRTAIKVYK